MKETNKWICVLAYILFFIPLIVDGQNETYKFHANQGLLVFLLGIANMIVALIPLIGWIIAPIVGIAALVFSIIGIINAINEQEKELPLIGSIRIIK